ARGRGGLGVDAGGAGSPGRAGPAEAGVGNRRGLVGRDRNCRWRRAIVPAVSVAALAAAPGAGGALVLPARAKRPSRSPMAAATAKVVTRRRPGRGPVNRAPPRTAVVSRANAVERTVVPLPGRGLVGEGGQEGLVVVVDTVTQHVVGRLVELGRERGAPGQGPQLDVEHVVGQPASVREAGVVTAEHTQRVGRGAR